MRVKGVEPLSPAWKTGILPLNYTRMVEPSGRCPRSPKIHSRGFYVRSHPICLAALEAPLARRRVCGLHFPICLSSEWQEMSTQRATDFLRPIPAIGVTKRDVTVKPRERAGSCQLVFSLLFTWPGDQPRHAACLSWILVEPISAPFGVHCGRRAEQAYALAWS